MSVGREELHHLVDELDEDKVPGAAALLRELAARRDKSRSRHPGAGRCTLPPTSPSALRTCCALSWAVLPDDLPLGAADASVIAVAERLGVHQVATFGHRHFTIVRPRHVEALEFLPA